MAVLVGEPPSPADDGKPGWVGALEAPPAAVTPVAWKGSTTATPTPIPAAKAPAFSFPAAARWAVTLGDPGRGAARTADRPVSVTAGKGSAAAQDLQVEVFDRAAAQRAGVSGFLFRVSRNSTSAHASATALPLRMVIDYSSFANAYGGNYADRLIVRTENGKDLLARNDMSAKTLTVDVADLGSAQTFAVTSGVSGDTGTYAATPLSISGSWQVSPGSGAFTYSYPIDLPKPASGSAPTVALSYTSAAIDGMTLASNTQASPSGAGWSDFANAFIERRYEPCIHTIGTTDLCWKSDNAVISLGGISGSMIPKNAAGTEWVLESDPQWKIQRRSGAAYTDIHDTQFWVVTGPDGTRYHFGLGHGPGRFTNSILGVPVIADNPREPCRGPNDTLAGCTQGWRWYLDYVVDPDGNTQTYVYEREDNWYQVIGGIVGIGHYHRGALLKEIVYGGHDTLWDYEAYSARVTFGLEYRCLFLVDICPGPTAGSTSGFLDVPGDLLCTPSVCTTNAPSFFTSKRYSYVRTEVKVGTQWQPVAQHNIMHSFGDGAHGVIQKLQIAEIRHKGIAFGGEIGYPATQFGYTFRDNRADHQSNIPRAMRHNRISSITNPFGGQILVNYSNDTNPRFCFPDYTAWPRWDLNVQDCYPQSSKDGNHLRSGVFHKYLVMSVIERPGGGSPDMTTTYTYHGDPAWAFDFGAFARDEDETGWSQWRGYSSATITKGVSKQRVSMFRGMHGDPMLQLVNGDWVPTGSRVAEVRTFDNAVGYPDQHSLAGRIVEEQSLGTLNNVADSVLQSRRHEYQRETSYDPGPSYRFRSEWVGLRSTTESVATAPGVFRQRRSVTTYNANRQPSTTLEEGWLHVTGDERCSITTYADNTAKGMIAYPASNKKVAGSCSSTDVLTLSETYYDDTTTLGAAPTRGNATRHRTLIETGRWSESTTQYDLIGRPKRTVNPNGGATTTVYEVTAGAHVVQIPIKTTETNPAGHVKVTEWHPEYGVAKNERDANNNLTSYSYDHLGRLTMVWLPTEPIDYLEPSWRFAYDPAGRVISARRLVSESRCCTNVAFEESWIIYDGMWRERQVQGRSPVSGKTLVSETTYDDRGQVREETVEQALTGNPGTYLDGGSSWQNRTRYAYDALGRVERKEWYRGSAVASTTTTSYTFESSTVTGPTGRKVTERVDGLGRTISVAEQENATTWATSSYTYDLADRLRTMTDPAGNVVTYFHNLAGWRTGQTDPNRGAALFLYDDAGNQTAAIDAALKQVHTRYDSLDRPLERRADSQTGPVLASWAYDQAPGGKGKPHKEITHTAGGNWVSEVMGYDIKGRLTATKLTVPAGIAGLSGSYTVSQTYDRADRVRTVTYPAIGGLAQETVTTDYNDLGLATRMAGLAEYVWQATYDDRGRKASAGFGPRPSGATWMAKTWSYDVDQRVNGAETFLAGSAAPSGIVSDQELVFDHTGNISDKLTRLNGQAWRECFGYDPRNRLAAAHTILPTTACGQGSPGTGDRPYRHEYTYSVDGKMLTRKENSTVTSYTYPASGAAQPHAPKTVGANIYTWDAEGRLATRTVAGRNETLTWNAEDRLASVTGPDGTSSFVYDPSGQRLLRKAPNGQATLYVAGHEVTVTSAGAAVLIVRPYVFNGQLVAVRTAAGVHYMITDAAGSVEASIASGATTLATRSYLPFGKVRASTGDTPGDRGFAGQIEDGATSLSYLNARYYDASTGVFISTDPIVDKTKIQTLNPYSYSANNPVSYSDASGLYSSYTFGVELENASLREQNRALRDYIGQLENHISELQDVIRKQQKQIDDLLNYVEALEAEIARQASIIRQLQARVAYLERVVAAQAREISRLRRVVAYQAGVIRYQAGVIRYQRAVISQMIFRSYRASVGSRAIGKSGGTLSRYAGGGRDRTGLIGWGRGMSMPRDGMEDTPWWPEAKSCFQGGGHAHVCIATARAEWESSQPPKPHRDWFDTMVESAPFRGAVGGAATGAGMGCTGGILAGMFGLSGAGCLVGGTIGAGTGAVGGFIKGLLSWAEGY